MAHKLDEDELQRLPMHGGLKCHTDFFFNFGTFDLTHLMTCLQHNFVPSATYMNIVMFTTSQKADYVFFLNNFIINNRVI